jgi:hypothetical protein
MEAIDVVGVHRVPWSKGKLTGQKPPLKLKEIWAIRICLQLAAKTRELEMFNLAIDSKLRACDLTKLRDLRYLSWLSGGVPGNRYAAEDSAAGSVRNHRADSRKCGSVDAGGRTVVGRLSVPEQDPRLAASLDASVRSTGPSLDRIDWARRYGLRNAYDAANKGVSYIPAHQEFAGGSAAARAHQARKHRTVSRHRGRRCT